MKKKTKKRLKILLWGLVSAAFVSLLFLKPPVPTPRQRWRVPVEVERAMPSFPSLPKLAPYELKLEPPQAPSQGAVPPQAPLVPPVQPQGATGRGAKIAIIIDDVGPLEEAAQRALDLPAVVTLSFLPYAPKIQKYVSNAKQKGHEIFLHLPMEPLSAKDPGPNALTTALDDAEMKRRIDINLNAFEGYVGVNNHMGSRLTADRHRLEIVAQALKEKGVFFVDSRTNLKSIAAETVGAAGVPVASRDVFLDDDQAPEAIRRELDRLETIARAKGKALAIGHPHEATLRLLQAWLPEAEKRGFVLVPAGQLVQ